MIIVNFRVGTECKPFPNTSEGEVLAVQTEICLINQRLTLRQNLSSMFSCFIRGAWLMHHQQDMINVSALFARKNIPKQHVECAQTYGCPNQTIRRHTECNHCEKEVVQALIFNILSHSNSPLHSFKSSDGSENPRDSGEHSPSVQYIKGQDRKERYRQRQ